MCSSRILMNCVAIVWMLYTVITVAAWFYFLHVTKDVAQWHLILLSTLVWLNVAQFGAFLFILICMRFQHTTLKIVPEWKALPSNDHERFEVGAPVDIEMKPRRRAHRKHRRAEEEQQLEVAISRIEAAIDEQPEVPEGPPPELPAVDEMRSEVESDLNPES